MALSFSFGRRNNMPLDPMEAMVSLFELDAPAASFARDAYSMANTTVDWKETASEHVIKADLPGLRKEDVQVKVEDGRTLTISGQRKTEEVQHTDTWHRVERTGGSFFRKFRLPEDTDLDAIKAKVDSGVLTVVVPKVEKKKPEARRIEIGGEAPAIAAPDEYKVNDAAAPAQSPQQ